MYLRLSHMPNAILHHAPTVLSPAYYYGKKKSKRVGRPPGGHSNLEGGVKRRGRRRKRRKQLFVHKKRRSSASVDNTPAGSPQVTETLPPYIMMNHLYTWVCKQTKKCCCFCLWLHRAVERKRIWMKMTHWVKTPVQSCRMISRMILSSRSGSLSPPRRLLPHRRHPDPHADAGNLAHPHSLMTKIALPHQR